MNAKRHFTSSIVLGAALSVVFCGSCAPKISDQSIRPVSAAEVMTKTADKPKGILVMDTRPEDVFAAGHLPGARNFRLRDVSGERRDPRLEGYKTILVYAENPGSASARAMTKRLLSLDYSDVRLMEEGYEGWTARGLPVESSN